MQESQMPEFSHCQSPEITLIMKHIFDIFSDRCHIMIKNTCLNTHRFSSNIFITHKKRDAGSLKLRETDL